MKICSKGVWDETIPGIEFDENGISNFCILQKKMMQDYPRGEEGLNEWKSIVDKIKSVGKKHTYDCIIGVSGGVDSSYLLHIAHHYGLRTLAVNLDNGFNSEIAVRNIYKITKKLNIDLETYVINYEEIKDLLRAYMRAGMAWADTPTDLAIKAVMYKYANKENIKYILRGNDFRSEGKQPVEWTYSDNKQLRYIHKRYGKIRKLKSYPFLPFRKLIFYGIVKGVVDIRPYYYLEYSKQNARKILESEYDWKDYGGHHHENLFTKFTMAYWLPKKFNIDKRKINLSAQVLNGDISRDDALKQLSKDFDEPQKLEELKNYVLKKLELTNDEFTNIWNSDNHFYYDYPSNYSLIFSNIKRYDWLIKRLFKYKPMSIGANEMIPK
jgi:N-acetyl sugar amidotransferase